MALRSLQLTAKWAWRAAWAFLLLGSTLILVSGLVLHHFILPRIDTWREPLTQKVGDALGVSLHIGAIEVNQGGWMPVLTLRDVQLRPRGAPPDAPASLVLPEIYASVSARSLLAWQWRFEQLHIARPHLEIRRDQQGQLHVAGIPLVTSNQQAGPHPAMNWVFRQPEVFIHQASVRWTDELTGVDAVELTQVDLLLRNGFRRHAWRIDATPPAPWGERFSVRGRFNHALLAEPGDLRQWRGTAYATLPYANMASMSKHLPMPIELSEGQGTLRAWVDVEDSQLTGFTTDLSLGPVRARLAPPLDPLSLSSLSGRMSYTQFKGGGQLSLTDWTFQTDAGQVWPKGDSQLSWHGTPTGPSTLRAPTLPWLGEVARGQFTAQALDLGLLTQLGTQLPLGDQAHQWLRQLDAQGQVKAMDWRWRGPLTQPQDHELSMQVQQLHLAANGDLLHAGPDEHAWPGLSGVDLKLTLSPAGGEAQVLVKQGHVALPGLFREAQIPVDELKGKVSWTKGDGQRTPFTLRIQDLQLKNQDGQIRTDMTWRTGLGEHRLPGHLDLEARGEGLDATQVARYLPTVLGDTALDYVAHSLQGGQVKRLEARVRGDLQHFPFHQVKEGEFRISAIAQDVTYAYVPDEPAVDQTPAVLSPWPRFTKASGEVVVDRDRLLFKQMQARYQGVQLQGINGSLEQLSHDTDTHLHLEGGAKGPGLDFLRYLSKSPVGDWLGGALSKTQITGPVDLKLTLDIPIHQLPKSTVKGSVQLSDNDVQFEAGTPWLRNTRAKVEFNHQGMTIKQATTHVLGGESTLEGGSQPDGSLRIAATGQISAEGLRQAKEIKALPALAQHLHGQTSYRLSMVSQHNQTEWQISSLLQGMGSRLPVPLAKQADTSWPLKLHITPQGGPSAEGHGKDTLRLELGPLLNGVWEREWQAARADEGAMVRRGLIQVGDLAVTSGKDNAEALPAQGVQARLNLPSFNVDAWQQLLPSLGLGDGADTVEEGGYGPTSIQLQSELLQVASRELHQVRAQLDWAQGKQDKAWRAQIQAKEMKGTAELRLPQGEQPARIDARLERLALPEAVADQLTQALDQAPPSMPALDIVVDHLELKGKQLGRLEVAANHRMQSNGQRDWLLQKLQISNPDATLHAQGSWAVARSGGRRQTELQFQMDLQNAGSLLERLGMGRTVAGGKGNLNGRVSWTGSPMQPDYPTLGGQMQLAVERGRFLKIEPGAGRLIGVLNMQALPRRLTLDFRDLFQEGFAFDALGGDISIKQGVAQSNNLRLRGVQAAVLIDGQSNLAEESQDLQVYVVPEINAGTASLAYAAINPAIGIGTFLAQMFLRKPLAEANTRQFHVTGTWQDPKVTPVQRGSGANNPDIADLPPVGPSQPRTMPAVQ